jgi:hypothetical protein
MLPTPRITRWFQIHSFQSFSRDNNYSDPKHYEWLKQPHDFPIYMQKVFEQIPASVMYPIEEVKGLFGTYLTSTFAYMMALAILEKVDQISIFGFEMGSGTEYAYQRPCGEFLIGYARAKGIEVNVPDNSQLLRGRMYGYEDDMIGLSQLLEVRLALLRAQYTDAERKFFISQGRNALLAEIFGGKTEITNEMAIAEQTAMMEASALANMVNGARKEVEIMIKVTDSHNGLKAVEDVLKEEVVTD